MRAARWTTPSLRLRSVVTGTSQLPATFKPNPTLLRPPLLSKCPTESTEGILLHLVEHNVSTTFLHQFLTRSRVITCSEDGLKIMSIQISLTVSIFLH